APARSGARTPSAGPRASATFPVATSGPMRARPQARPAPPRRVRSSRVLRVEQRAVEAVDIVYEPRHGVARHDACAPGRAHALAQRPIGGEPRETLGERVDVAG